MTDDTPRPPHRNPALVGFVVFWAALWLGQVVIGRAVLHYDISWPEVLLGRSMRR